MGKNLWIYGLNPVRELLRRRPHKVEEIRIHRRKGTPEEILDVAKKFSIPIKESSRQELESFCGSTAHQGIIASAPLPEYLDLEKVLKDIKTREAETGKSSALILILDSISDPQNLGSLIRVAECAGADAVILPRDRAAGLSPAAAKASAGAIEWLPVCMVVNLKRTIEELKQAGFWVACASSERGDSIWQSDLAGKTAVVIGAEGAGVRPGVAAACDYAIRIPLQGKIESLNASVSAGIILFDILRQGVMKNENTKHKPGSNPS